MALSADGNTLYSLPSYHMGVEYIRPDSHEEPVQNLWQIIATTWFPAAAGYRYGFKAPILNNDNMPDIIVIQIQPQAGHQNPDPRNPNDWTERQIMLIECKRPSLDTPGGWHNTIDGQFEDDCSQTLNPSQRIFGAVAIGRRVQFFQVDATVPVGGAGRRVQLSGILDLNNNADFITMTQRMDQVKNQGWAWAS
ncbi:hypothetical protein BDV19DRAFT_391962 [Aspergillus venezuelensis]